MASCLSWHPQNALSVIWMHITVVIWRIMHKNAPFLGPQSISVCCVTRESLPRPVSMHHPQIGARRFDHVKRHPEISPLSPTVAPTVLDKSELFRLVVAQAEHFMATLLLFARFRNRHNAGIRHLLGH